jgi:hypothetical protein
MVWLFESDDSRLDEKKRAMTSTTEIIAFEGAKGG